MIFLIYDHLIKDYIAPNGFNIALDEFESHRFRIASNSNHDFRRESLLNLDKSEVIPISIQSYEANPEFFNNLGTVYYIIGLNKTIGHYPFLFTNGMNSWLQ